jgi:hypothetical protein
MFVVCNDACNDRLIRARISFPSPAIRRGQIRVRAICASALMQENLGTEVSDDQPWNIQDYLCSGNIQTRSGMSSLYEDW